MTDHMTDDDIAQIKADCDAMSPMLKAARPLLVRLLVEIDRLRATLSDAQNCERVLLGQAALAEAERDAAIARAEKAEATLDRVCRDCARKALTGLRNDIIGDSNG